jgi:hypothetical protein
MYVLTEIVINGVPPVIDLISSLSGGGELLLTAGSGITMALAAGAVPTGAGGGSSFLFPLGGWFCAGML